LAREADALAVIFAIGPRTSAPGWTSRIKSKGLVEVNIIDLRAYATNKHRTTDDYAFGGGAGMVGGWIYPLSGV